MHTFIRLPSSAGTSALIVWLAAVLGIIAVDTVTIAAAENTSALERLQGQWSGKGPGGPCSVSISGHTLLYEQPTPAGGDEFWYETTFTLPTGTDPPQLHATIVRNSSEGEPHVGTLVVTIFKIEENELTLGVVKSYEEPPTEPVAGDWDQVIDVYSLERSIKERERAD